MLFNSSQFIIYFFLPVFFLFLFTVKFSRSFRVILVSISSLYFYSQWYKPYFFLLFSSIIINYLFCVMFTKRKISQNVFLVLGITFNISLLCIFKYSAFIAENLALIRGINLDHQAWFLKIVLPLGISFYSFQKPRLVV